MPSFADAGLPDLVLDEWNGIVMPSGTPPPVIGKLGTTCRQALQDPVLLARLEVLGAANIVQDQGSSSGVPSPAETH